MLVTFNSNPLKIDTFIKYNETKLPGEKNDQFDMLQQCQIVLNVTGSAVLISEMILWETEPHPKNPHSRTFLASQNQVMVMDFHI